MTTCPQCGYQRTGRDDEFVSGEECPRCGIFYKKWTPPAGAKAAAADGPGPLSPATPDEAPAPATGAGSGSVNLIHVIALLMLVDSTLQLLGLLVALFDGNAGAAASFASRAKHLYDFLMAGALFATSFGLVLAKRWARVLAVILLSLALAEGLFAVVLQALIFWGIPQSVESRVALGLKLHLGKLVVCLLTFGAIVVLCVRKSEDGWTPLVFFNGVFRSVGKSLFGRAWRVPVRGMAVAGAVAVSVFAAAVYLSRPAAPPGQPPAPGAGAGVEAVSASRTHTLAVSGGLVWAWGDNLHGQLGHGARGGMSSTPGFVEGLSGVRDVRAGQDFSVALKGDGTVWTWGNNEAGQLGNGSPLESSARPVRIEAIADVVAIAAGHSHALALKKDGTVWAWGNNAMGELGDGTMARRMQPVGVPDLDDVVAISTRLRHSLALKRDGTLWAWGWNDRGQLGDGTRLTRYEPVEVNGIGGVRAIAAGGTFSAAVKNDGTIWLWGDNYESRPGGVISVREPKLLHEGLKPLAIAAGDTHLLILDQKGAIRMANNRIHGRWGDLTDFRDAVAVACGHNSSFAVRRDRSLWAWGQNEFGELGDGTSGRKGRGLGQIDKENFWKKDPVRVKELTVAAAAPAQTTPAPPEPAASTILAVACGDHHSAAVKSDGTVWTWGDNGYRQLGRSAMPANRQAGAGAHIPGRVEVVGDVVAVAAGAEHTAALTRAGSVWEWGRTLEDRLYRRQVDGMAVSETLEFQRRAARERGRPLPAATPAPRTDLNEVSALAAGSGFTLALKRDGTVWGWGWNGLGELGNGSTRPGRQPTQVVGLNGITDIAAGRSYGMALRYDKTVWVWGLIRHAEHPRAAEDASLIPVQVQGLEGVTALAGGAEGLALKSDGTLWRCWTPIRESRDILEASPVGGLDRVRTLAASATHAVAVKNDGTLWAWGNNSFGQLGDGTRKYRPLPVRVGEIPEVASVAAGHGHTLALAKDGTIWMWGANSHDELCTSITVSSTAFPGRCDGF